jgi:hypothetical protein
MPFSMENLIFCECFTSVTMKKKKIKATVYYNMWRDLLVVASLHSPKSRDKVFLFLKSYILKLDALHDWTGSLYASPIHIYILIRDSHIIP